MKYIVITSKHHDGFAMFDSKASDWNIVKASPYGRDPLKDLAAACRKEGIKLGFYYSQAQDWNNGGAAAGGKWDKAQEHDMDDYIDKIAVPQIREILTNYGKDIPAVVWWDTPTDMNKDRADRINKVIQELRPDLITNNRLGGGYAGDTETPEQFIPARGYPGRDWESCMTMNGTWGFKSDDNNWKSTETLIRNLCDIASKGGNYLLNVGPTSEGLIPAPSIERLAQVGAWMKINGESIYGTQSGPFVKAPVWGRVSQKTSGGATTLYLHVFEWPKDGKLILPGLQSSPKSAVALVTGEKLKFNGANGDLVVTVPASAPDAIASVLKLEFDGPLLIEKRIPVQKADGTVSLSAVDADINNSLDTHAVLEKVNGVPTVTGWSHDKSSVSWIFEIKKAGTYSLVADYEAKELACGDIKMNEKKGSTFAFAPNTPGAKPTVIGTVTISKAGETDLKLSPQKGLWKDVVLRSISLRPAS
jgi:alpha-L-fucosidase